MFKGKNYKKEAGRVWEVDTCPTTEKYIPPKVTNKKRLSIGIEGQHPMLSSANYYIIYFNLSILFFTRTNRSSSVQTTNNSNNKIKNKNNCLTK